LQNATGISGNGPIDQNGTIILDDAFPFAFRVPRYPVVIMMLITNCCLGCFATAGGVLQKPP
jgi:hypothetical protein